LRVIFEPDHQLIKTVHYDGRAYPSSTDGFTMNDSLSLPYIANEIIGVNISYLADTLRWRYADETIMKEIPWNSTAQWYEFSLDLSTKRRVILEAANFKPLDTFHTAVALDLTPAEKPEITFAGKAVADTDAQRMVIQNSDLSNDEIIVETTDNVDEMTYVHDGQELFGYELMTGMYRIGWVEKRDRDSLALTASVTSAGGAVSDKLMLIIEP
ncbi:MAG: hypothetical protein ACQEQV_03350, partial [Fibrobacterota bacterium]